MQYPTLDICHTLLFPIIRKEMAHAEPAPAYEDERRGLDKLESTFVLMERSDYDGVFAKAAYLFCSIIDGHPFSNGNKRLAVAVLTYFLLINAQRVSVPSMEVLREELQRTFPNLRWENVHAFRHPHEYFFYHLALIIADRAQKGQMSFRQEQAAVQELLIFVTNVPS